MVKRFLGAVTLAATLLAAGPGWAQSLQQGTIQPLGSAAVTPQQNGPAAPVTSGSAAGSVTSGSAAGRGKPAAAAAGSAGSGTMAPASPGASNPAPQRFDSEVDARTACGSQPAVWVNTRTKRFSAAASGGYGRTGPGTFMCRDTASAAGFRAARP